jgi:hypothetical protein
MAISGFVGVMFVFAGLGFFTIRTYMQSIRGSLLYLLDVRFKHFLFLPTQSLLHQTEKEDGY